ncbi:MAG: hypothetical protein A2145_06630 [candidate division Zixibacteria bacterium RBG_16_40_9]|nr:MAG: hypothetical protein A2145_06630 [candidate division Zixibacteria bacterium RBG_16_40_9]
MRSFLKQFFQKDKNFLFFVFIFSFVLRLIYLLEIKDNPHFYNLTLDPLYHDSWAKQIASGDWMGSQVFFRAPFYPYFLAVLYKIFGPHLFLVRLIQHLIGSFSIVLIFLLAKKIFDRKVAVLASFLAATYWIFIYYEAELLLDFWLVLWSLLLIWFLLKAYENLKSSTWFLSGIILGLFTITRPNILLFLPFLLLWLIMVLRKQVPYLKILLFYGWVLSGTALVILPVTLRNYLVAKDPVLIASQGGINFYIGNNPKSDGMSAIVPELGDDWEYSDCQFMAENTQNRKLKPSEVSGFYYKKGWEFIFMHPTQSLPLLIKKLYVFWNKFEISNNQNIYFFKQYSVLSRILFLGFWLIGPLALLGIFLSIKRGPKTSLILLFIFSYMLSVIIFFVTSRYRLPVLPFLIIFASFAGIEIYRKISSKDFKSFLLAGALLVLFFILINSNFYKLDRGSFAQSYFGLGNVYLKRGDFENALIEYQTALEKNPSLPRAHLNRGVIFFKMGNYTEAEKEFLEELKVNPQEEKAYNNLSVLYRLKGKNSQALEYAQKAIQLRPNYSFAYYNLSSAYQAQNKLAQGESVLVQATQILPEASLLRYTLAIFYQKTNQVEKAQEQYLLILKGSEPKKEAYDLSQISGLEKSADFTEIKANSFYNLGLILGLKGELNLAEENFKKALQIRPNWSEAHSNLGKVYEVKNDLSQALNHFGAAVQNSPQKAIYHYNLGMLYLKLNQKEKALKSLQQALALEPDFKPALEVIKQIQKRN